MKKIVMAMLLLCIASASGAVSNTVRIIDGDTVDVNGVRYRLEGIDAPEISQRCRAYSGTWNCGEAARDALVAMAAGKRVECIGDKTDSYGRVLGYCFADGRDLNREMVRQGYAWAFRKYSTTYIADEGIAHRNQRGIWQAETQTAWDYRAQKWQVAEQSAPNGCSIKGNISKNGKIYHMPWSKWYGRTKISIDKGERWFCNEAEARAAGWRAAL